jgi:GH25 family lysozyme M1 (1,4-beta-N-acetylmuramidase)
MPDPLNAVIDISHHNGNVNLDKAVEDGIVGVIQKATQGLDFQDPTYGRNKKRAQDASLMFGAYHFGTGSDGVQQAEHFLEVVQPDASTLVVLDLEDNHQGPSMTLEEARAFVTHIKDSLDRFPGLYSGHYVKRLLGTSQDPVLGSCWFWLAQYGPTAVVPPTWPAWTMWQYTDGALGPEPHTVAGVGRCDRDKFNGELEGLRKLWGV